MRLEPDVSRAGPPSERSDRFWARARKLGRFCGEETREAYSLDVALDPELLESVDSESEPESDSESEAYGL